MRRGVGVIGVVLCGVFLSTSFRQVSAGAADDKKQVAFVNRTLEQRLKTIRKQLKDNQLGLVEKNIRGATESLQELARLTKRIRSSEPGFSPDPPIDFSSPPAASRQKEYTQAKRLAIEAGKQINRDYQTANQELLKAKNRQMATIAISALKFTVENAPGRPGGKVSDLVVEGVKKLNGYLMDTYVAQPIARTSEVELLKKNFVTIQDAARLMRILDQSRENVLAVARQMDQKARELDPAVAAEKVWQKYAWLKTAGAGQLTVEILDVRARDLELSLGGKKVDAASKGKTIRVGNPLILSARVNGKRRKFCLERREYAKRTKTIIIHSGPGGGPADSLVYSSSRIPARSSWTIEKEAFRWKPSFNSTVESDPRAVSGAYWKLEEGRVRWKLQAKPGEQVNLKVDGKIDWKFEADRHGKKIKNQESNDGSATLVLKIVE
jgi:hypothetical protein